MSRVPHTMTLIKTRFGNSKICSQFEDYGVRLVKIVKALVAVGIVAAIRRRLILSLSQSITPFPLFVSMQHAYGYPPHFLPLNQIESTKITQVSSFFNRYAGRSLQVLGSMMVYSEQEKKQWWLLEEGVEDDEGSQDMVRGYCKKLGFFLFVRRETSLLIF